MDDQGIYMAEYDYNLEPVTVSDPTFDPHPPPVVGQEIVINGERGTITLVKEPEPSNPTDWTVKKIQKEPRQPHTNGRREDPKRYAYAPVDGTPVETVKHPRVRGCGHKYVVGHKPQHRNCRSCWNALFINDAATSEAIAKGIVELGPEEVGRLLGKKLLQYYLEFVTIVAEMEKWKTDHEPKPEEEKS